MNQDLHIRPATSADLEILEEFQQGVIAYERTFAPNLKPDPIQYYDPRSFMDSEDAILLIGEIGDQVVGCGYADIRQNSDYKLHELYAYLGFMYVLPSHRGQGINGQILQSLIDWSREKGIKEIQLEVYSENKSAIKAYAKKGFKPFIQNMILSVE